MEHAAPSLLPLRAEPHLVPEDKNAATKHRGERCVVRRQRAGTPPRLLGKWRGWLLRQRRWGLVWLSEDHVDSDACSAKRPDLFHELREPAARPRPATKTRKTSLVEAHDHDSSRRLKAVRRLEQDIVGLPIQFG